MAAAADPLRVVARRCPALRTSLILAVVAKAMREAIPRRRLLDCARRAFGGRLTEDVNGPGPESPVRKARSDWFEPDGAKGERDAPDTYARGGWIGPARERMEKKGTVGALHKQLGVASGDKIPSGKLSAAKARAKRTGNTQLMRRVTFAQNVRK
jgi:hypothetical protein